MNERIARLVKAARSGEIFPACVGVEYDEFDLKLADPLRIAKRLSEYMEAQPCCFTDDNELVGLMRFDGSVEAALFPRTGHRFFRETKDRYYRKPQENLCTFEWQHSNADFGKVIRLGLEGFRREIIESRKNCLCDLPRLNFLAGLEAMIRGIVRRARQYAAECRRRAAGCADPARRAALLRMAANCMQVPEHPARSFEEAVQCLYFCFTFQPDSIGRPDQYLLPLYRQGIADGTLTSDHARELLQELFVMIHGYTPYGTFNADKGAESHFVIGGCTVDHQCAWNELSELILDALMETDLIRPQLSLRWNKLTPRSVLRRVMDCERRDRNKRIALVNDEPRIEAMLARGIPWETAYDYIMVGCNEPAFQGGISLGGNKVNIVRSLVNTLDGRREEVLAAEDFDAFYAIYEQELHSDLETVLDYSNRFNMLRSRDCNVLTSLFMTGCIERAVSVTQGGAARARWSADFMGATNLIDSLCIIRQFVYEEKLCTMAELLAALAADWQGYGELRSRILKHGRFFGNHDEFSDAVARRFYASVGRFADGRTDLFGNALFFGNLTGYYPHFAWFGAQTPATPDGRCAGSALLFGGGQSEGKDRDGLTSLLLSVAHMDDTTGVMRGNAILNISVDESAVRDDESFEKLVALIEVYFKEGGLHVQLNHVSAEELAAAKKDPARYKSLRVRVSGFSATFVDLAESIQDNVIARTVDRV